MIAEARGEPDNDMIRAETMAWISDPDHAAEMAEAEGDIANGRMISLEEVPAQLAQR